MVLTEAYEPPTCRFRSVKLGISRKLRELSARRPFRYPLDILTTRVETRSSCGCRILNQHEVCIKALWIKLGPLHQLDRNSLPLPPLQRCWPPLLRRSRRLGHSGRSPVDTTHVYVLVADIDAFVLVQTPTGTISLFGSRRRSPTL